MTNNAARPAPPRRFAWSAFLLGVAMSGFFDGILLHQVLQWHHLLSLVPGQALQDPRVQVFADGLFHVLMYLVALVGMTLIWRARAGTGGPASRRVQLGSFIAGFGAWNIVDVVFFHSVLHIHNIRLDVPNPLVCDAGWLMVFGAAPLLIGVLVLSRGDGPSDRRGMAATLSVVTLAAGLGSLTPAQSEMTAVLFRPGLTDSERWAAVARADARVVATDASGDLMVVSLPTGSARWRLFADGALVVGGAMGGGCLTNITLAQTRL